MLIETNGISYFIFFRKLFFITILPPFAGRIALVLSLFRSPLSRGAAKWI